MLNDLFMLCDLSLFYLIAITMGSFNGLGRDLATASGSWTATCGSGPRPPAVSLGAPTCRQEVGAKK